MYRSLAILSLLLVVGCSVGPTPQEEYDTALKILNRQQERLDALRPAYDLAQQKAAMQVCKEIAGTTPEESASAALEQLQNIMTGPTDGGAPAAEPKEPKDKTNVNDLDATIDNLVAAQKDFQVQQAAISAPIAKANEVMQKIHTPGTPEAKRYEEVLAATPEVKAYKRQEERLARAQKAADAAEAALNGAAKQ
jgi:hypothetical protein